MAFMKVALNRQNPGFAATVLAGFLLLAMRPPVALSASVTVQEPLKSGPTVRPNVLLGGKAQPGAKVQIYRYEFGTGQEAKPRVSLVTDSHGKVFPPKLTPGHYHVVASAPRNLTAELYLDVSAKDSENASVFSMELGIGSITREELLAQAEQMPVKERVRAFTGIVRDPSGNPIPDVSIEIVRILVDTKVITLYTKSKFNQPVMIRHLFPACRSFCLLLW